jgi:hypothetical protein
MTKRIKLPKTLHNQTLELSNGHRVIAHEVRPGTRLWASVPVDQRSTRIYRLKYPSGVRGKQLYPHEQLLGLQKEGESV